MKDSDVYRTAAQLLESGKFQSPYSCDHIYYAIAGNHIRGARLCEEYSLVFGEAEWWDKRGDGRCGHPVNRSFKGQRILALCFMAAIAEAGERA